MVESGEGERCRERPKDGYINLRPVEMILESWAPDEKIIPRYAYRLQEAARLMVESRSAAENTRRKKSRAGQKVKVEQTPTYGLVEAQKITGSSLKDLAKAKALLLKTGLIQEWSDHQIRFATGINDLNLDYLQEQFPDFAEKRARYEQKLRAIHPKRLNVRIRFPRKFLRAIARGQECEWSRSAMLLYAGIRCLFVETGTNLIHPVGRLDLTEASFLFGRCTKSLKAALKEVAEDWHALEVLDDGRVAVNLDWDGIPVDTTPAEQAETEITAADLPQNTTPEDRTSTALEEIADKTSPPSILYKQSPLQERKTHPPACGRAADGDLKIKKGQAEKNSRYLFTITHREQLITLSALYEIFLKLVGAGYFQATKSEFIELVGFGLRAYERYLHPKTTNAGGLFYTWVTNRQQWTHRISLDLEDQAKQRVDEYIERIEAQKLKPLALPPPAVQQSMPALSPDAADVQTVREVLTLEDFRGDFFTELNRQDPDWTRERWDQATQELAAYQAEKRKSPIRTVGEMIGLGTGLGILDQRNYPSDADFEADVARKTGHSRGKKFSVVKANDNRPEFAGDEQQRVQVQQANKRRVQKEKQQRLEFAKRGLEKDRWFDAHAICEQLLVDSPSLVDEAVGVLRKEDADFESLYQSRKSPLENYQGSPFHRTLVDKYLEQKHPEHFQDIRDTYDGRLNEMSEKLAA